MNPEQILARLRALGRALTWTQRITLAVTFLSVAGVIVGSAYWLNRTNYTLLFSDMDAESASEVVTRLRAQKVDFRLEEGGRAIRVPTDRIDELRLELSAQGLPVSGRLGFELFDRTAFGATEFLEQVNYRRALEGEIARTIATLSEVSGARVHIAMAKDSVFGTRQQPAKASVVLKLRNERRSLSPGTVQGIVSLVAASVEGLRPEAVVVLDSFGRPVSRSPEPDEADMGGAHLERQQRLERALSERVVSLLEPVVGFQRVRVNVSARMNPSSEQETEERWDPDGSVVRSRQLTADRAAAAAASAGIAGARANLPPPAPATEGTGETSVPVSGLEPALQPDIPGGRHSETTNYEVSKVVRHTVRPRGELARLSVAVIVDDELIVEPDEEGRPVRSMRPRSAAEIQKIHGLVAAAVGLEPDRGDQLTVENISFGEPIAEAAPAPSSWEWLGPQVLEAARIGAVVLLGLAAFLLVIRPVVRRIIDPLPALPAGALPQLPRTVEDLQGEIEAELDAVPVEHRKMPVLTKRLTSLAQKEPQNVARLLRSWIAEEQR